MTVESIASIIKRAAKFKDPEEKAKFLKENESDALKVTLKVMYGGYEWLLPDVAPPYKPNELFDIEGLYYKEVRRLPIFLKGMGYDAMRQSKREHLFISLLEDIDAEDAKMLVRMIEGKPYKGLDRKTIAMAFPEVFPNENNPD